MLPIDSVSQNAQVIDPTPSIHTGGHSWVKMLPIDSVSQNAQVIDPTPSIHTGGHSWVGLY